MSESQRRIVVGILAAVAVACGVSFVTIAGSFLHGETSGAVGAGEVQAPSFTGWVTLISTFIGMWQGGSLAKWLATAVPVVTPIVQRIGELPKLETAIARVRSTPLAPLLSLLESINIDAAKGVESHGDYPLGGGKLTWTIQYEPPTEGK